MTKFRNRITVIFILLLGLSNIAAGIFTITVVRNSQIESMETGLNEKLQVYLSTVDWSYVKSRSVGGEMFPSEAARIAREVGARVTFFDAGGSVLGDSAAEAASPDELLPEIADAMSGAIGFDIRSDGTGGSPMMYVALPAAFDTAGTGFVRFGESLADVDRETLQLASYLGLGLLGILLITAVVAYRISQNLTGPLEQITKVAYQITNMNYNSRVSIPNKDEIGQLGQAVNLMSASLQLQMTQIQENENRLKSVLDNMISGVIMIDRQGKIVLINRSAEEQLGLSAEELLDKTYRNAMVQQELAAMIQECLESRKHIRDEVVVYYPEERILDIHLVPVTGVGEEWGGIVVAMHDITAIRRLERMRSDFVANVSHEIKTPIAAVKGFAETLLGGAVDDPDTAKSFLQIIYDESERLDRLIGDILALSKIESKRIPLNFSPIELNSFVERALQMMETTAAKKHIALEARVDGELYIEADEDRLMQILINLLSNGITYSYDNGKLRVLVEPIVTSPHLPLEDYDRVRITVQDFGIGIPKKDLDRIFERFYRVDKARSRSSGGTGLGLSIVKHLVELHHGTIWVESTVGMGSKFIIELPALQTVSIDS